MTTEVIIKQNKIISDLKSHDRELVKKAISKVGKFFNAEIDFKIVFLETRKEMDELHKKFLGMKTPTEDWVARGIFERGTIHMFSEEAYSKVSCHPKETFFPTLVHEIAHIFTDKLFDFHLPMWLNEGISFVVAEQDRIPLFSKQDLTKAYTEEEWFQKNPYLTAGKFTQFLLDNYGKEKMFLLLKELDFYEREKEFKEKFKKILKDDFNKIWDNWRKNC